MLCSAPAAAPATPQLVLVCRKPADAAAEGTTLRGLSVLFPLGRGVLQLLRLGAVL